MTPFKTYHPVKQIIASDITCNKMVLQRMYNNSWSETQTKTFMWVRCRHLNVRPPLHPMETLERPLLVRVLLDDVESFAGVFRMRVIAASCAISSAKVRKFQRRFKALPVIGAAQQWLSLTDNARLLISIINLF